MLLARKNKKIRLDLEQYHQMLQKLRTASRLELTK